MTHYVLLVLHILATAVWLGGHALLVLAYLPEALRSGDPRLLVDAWQRLRRVGVPALIAAIITGLWLAWDWLPTTPLWFNTELPISRLILGKLSLLTGALLVQAYMSLRVLPTLTIHRLPRLGLCLVLQVLLALTAVALGSGFRYGGW